VAAEGLVVTHQGSRMLPPDKNSFVVAPLKHFKTKTVKLDKTYDSVVAPVAKFKTKEVTLQK